MLSSVLQHLLFSILLYLEAYVEASRTSMMDISCENIERLKVVNYFRKKTQLQMFDFEIKSTVNTVNKKLIKPAFCFC